MPRSPRAHDRDLRTGHRERHPDHCRVHQGAAARPRAVRHPPEPAPRRVHVGRDRVVAGARAARRVLPERVRRRPVVVPRRPGRHPALPGGGDGDRRVLAHVGLRRRHPRLLLDPGPPRHVPPPRRGLPRAARDGASARRGRGHGDRGRPRHRAAEAGVQAVSASTTPPTTTAELSRTGGHGRAAGPVRLVHLGLGNFFRAHQAWYTDRAPDAAEWGIAGFTGRSRRLADDLTAQEGLYTLVTRARDGDRFAVLGSLSRAHPAADHESWLGYFRSPEIRVVTVTVTEAGYLRDADGGLDRDRPEVRADIEALRRDLTAVTHTAPARLLAGLAARRAADAGPPAPAPCATL